MIIIEGLCDKGKSVLAGQFKSSTWCHTMTGGEALEQLHQARDIPINAYVNMFTDSVDPKWVAAQRGLQRILLSREAAMLICELDQPVMSGYTSLRSRSHLKCLNIVEAYTHITDVLEALRALRSPKNLGDGIGCFKEGNILMVGDQPAEAKGRKDYPFAADVGCSRWINKQLDSINYPEQNLYWINAIRADHTRTGPRFIDKLKPRAIIALGTVAQAWCEGNKLDYELVHHPSYWSRFKSKQRYPLLDILHQLDVNVTSESEL